MYLYSMIHQHSKSFSKRQSVACQKANYKHKARRPHWILKYPIGPYHFEISNSAGDFKSFRKLAKSTAVILPSRQYQCHALCQFSKQSDNWNGCYGWTNFHKIEWKARLGHNTPPCTSPPCTLKPNPPLLAMATCPLTTPSSLMATHYLYHTAPLSCSPLPDCHKHVHWPS